MVETGKMRDVLSHWRTLLVAALSLAIAAYAAANVAPTPNGYLVFFPSVAALAVGYALFDSRYRRISDALS